ncbi:hypothetical protein ACF1AB_36085 [Streptomyces sp. NPDC014846]|uniref:hypothetical protein n=1 Tax=Streptomyces sp. NPDC014846 TaxID=3364922 RepID=UPI003701EFCF
MTTPTPQQSELTRTPVALRPYGSAEVTLEDLERRARLESLQRWSHRARALDSPDAPPPAGPRDLTGLDTVMARVYENQAYYFSQPGWITLNQVYQQVTGVLEELTRRSERTPQAAIQAARITILAASLIARYAAQISSHLDTWKQGETPGGQAIRSLVRSAELHAARAAGLDDGQSPDTPRRLSTHLYRLDKAIQQSAPPRDSSAGSEGDDPEDPDLDAALAVGKAVDPDLDEASRLMTALTQLSERVRRAGYRLVLDVRLHGTVETAQLRGFEMISRIARSAMRRYDEQGRGTDGRRNIAAMIYHYAEQRLERMRGTLGADERRDFGHYEADPPERYLDTLFEESRTVTQELRAQHITPQERADLQIRFLLAQRNIAAAGSDGVQEWGTQATFPPTAFVAGMRTDSPVESRQALIEALRRRVENNPFHPDAHFLNKVADRLAQEIAGPPELTADALQADLTADQVRSVAQHLVRHRADETAASPLALSETAELNLTYAQAERALAVLQTLDVVGPPNGLQPRETLTVSRTELSSQLNSLEQRLPNLLAAQKGAAAVEAPAAPRVEAQPQASPAAHQQTQAPAAPTPPAAAEPAPATTASELPRRDRSAERRHPGNLGTRAAPAVKTAGDDQELAQLLDGMEERIRDVSEKLQAGTEARAAAHPALAEDAAAKATQVGEAQQNARQAHQTVGVGVR